MLFRTAVSRTFWGGSYRVTILRIPATVNAAKHFLQGGMVMYAVAPRVFLPCRHASPRAAISACTSESHSLKRGLLLATLMMTLHASDSVVRSSSLSLASMHAMLPCLSFELLVTIMQRSIKFSSVESRLSGCHPWSSNPFNNPLIAGVLWILVLRERPLM